MNVALEFEKLKICCTNYSQSHFMDFMKDTRWRLWLTIGQSTVGMELLQRIPLNSFKKIMDFSLYNL
jgi:hypothetical protein